MAPHFLEAFGQMSFDDSRALSIQAILFLRGYEEPSDSIQAD